MTPTIIMVILLIGLVFYSAMQFDSYLKLKRRNNDSCAHHLGLAIVSAVLCIFLSITILIGKKEFISNNQFKNCSMKERQMQTYASRTTYNMVVLNREAFFRLSNESIS